MLAQADLPSPPLSTSRRDGYEPSLQPTLMAQAQQLETKPGRQSPAQSPSSRRIARMLSASDDEAVEEAERRVDWKRCLAVSRGFVRAITTPPVTTAAENSVVMAL